MLGSYGNDHQGLRIEKEATDPLQPGALPVRVRTLWEGRHAFQDSDSSGAVVARYDSDGRRPVGLWSRDDGSQALHHDALGSIVATTDSAGDLKSETIYDAWGNPVIETGSSASKFGYTGHQRDRESGLIYFQARYYDPAIGRFLTRDPFEGDWNTPLSLYRYLYAYANPTVYIDLHGYESIFANIDKAAEGCGAWSCAGYALAKGAYAAATFGFAIVHDPVRDMYDDGKISGGQYAARGIGGGLAMVGVNVAGVAVGGVGSGATATVAGTMARGAATGAAIAGTTDAATQGVNISAGLQDRYEVDRTATAAVVGGTLGTAAPAVAAAGLNTQTGRAITGAVSSTVRKTAEAVESAAQSVGSRAKGMVTQEGSMLGTAGAPIRGKSVVAEKAKEGVNRMPAPDEPDFMGPVVKVGASNNVYTPASPLPMKTVPGVGDVPLMLPEAEGLPHSVLGSKVASDGQTVYRQTATFPGGSWPKADGLDLPWGRVDWTGHPYLPGPAHPNPHIHEFYYDFSQGQWRTSGAKPFYGH